MYILHQLNNYYQHHHIKKYCNNYKTWLNFAINHGWDKSLKIYYITEVFANNKVDWINHRLYAREIYDATYKYAMGTLTQNDVDNLCVEKDDISAGLDGRDS